MSHTDIQKTDIPTIARKNRVVDNIIGALLRRQHFLILGHGQPDEDCISSMVAMALLLSKLSKDVEICTDVQLPEHYHYLLKICRYNSIHINDNCEDPSRSVDTVIICDTPKPDMVRRGPAAEAAMESGEVLTIEIDHHLEADSRYCGDPDYALVAEASSAAELVGLLACKMNSRELIVENHPVPDLFSRNLVLTILTGIIGDTQMGKFIKSRKEQRFYSMFSEMFNRLLVEKTTKQTNFFNMEQVYNEIKQLSDKEAEFYEYMMAWRRFSTFVGYVALDEQESATIHQRFDPDTVSSVARGIADDLAEASGKLSLVAYYDFPGRSEFIQFRARRSQYFKDLDLRDILTENGIENGGGHEGAIGFRIPKSEVGDFASYIEGLIASIESML